MTAMGRRYALLQSAFHARVGLTRASPKPTYTRRRLQRGPRLDAAAEQVEDVAVGPGEVDYGSSGNTHRSKEWLTMTLNMAVYW